MSAFGFGGTNFHVVLEEHVPGRHRPPPRVFAGASVPTSAAAGAPAATGPTATTADPSKPPLRGALVLGGRDDGDLIAQVERALADARRGVAPAPTRPDPSIGGAPVRIAVDFADADDLAKKLDKALTALTGNNAAVYRMLRQQGVFVGRGRAPKVAFLYTGQGSQYVNMLRELRDIEPIVADTFREADEVMTPLLGRPLTSYIFIDGDDPAAVSQLEQELLQTEITQPAVLATDSAISRLLDAYGMRPDMVMGHSLGEYGALIAAGSLTFGAALEAVSARGTEMARLSVEDNGAMAAVFGPLTEIERIVDATPGYAVIANINSNNQAVVGGGTDAVLAAIDAFTAAGMQAIRIPVSHAFHTSIVAPASVPLVATLQRLDVRPPSVPLVANVTGEFYPADATTDTMLDYLGKQVASPVQFVKGLHSLYDAGARLFVEVGPKRALHGFVEDVLGDHDDVLAVYTNHPKLGDETAINQALCAMWASGVGFDEPTASATLAPTPTPSASVATQSAPATSPVASSGAPDDRIMQLGQLFAGVIEEGLKIYGADPITTTPPASPGTASSPVSGQQPVDDEPVVITGAALGLPGVEHVFDDANIGRILAGEQFISSLPEAARVRMAEMRITRVVKSESGGGSFETIDDPADVIKLAGLHAPIDVVEQFAVESARDDAFDSTTRLAIGAGYDALRDAGIPLVMRYKTTTLGTQLQNGWGLPDDLRDDTGVVFASAFPGYGRYAEEIEAYTADRTRREHLLALEGVRTRLDGDTAATAEVDRLIADLRAELEANPYEFDRRFLFRVLSMGHSQFAEIIGARGPNTQINAACASTTQAIAVAEDWIRSGRCRRVIVVSADDATGDALLPWLTSGFLASGAAATDERVEDAATPFDRGRHGMILGMGAAALVIEAAGAARERGVQPICDVLGAVTANSAFHGTRLDVEHIGAVMDAVVRQAESRGIDRSAIAGETMFVSHETYTPARGGSAAAEINALRRVFGDQADQVVITNTKGFTGHAMGAGIEDVVAVKALETGIVPPVPNLREPDPELGNLTLSKGGQHPVKYALRLAAGFGSQVAMALLRWTPMPDGQRRRPDQLGYSYRVVDPAAWQRWLDRLAGHDGARLEVDHRRLRIVDVGAPTTSRHESAVPVPYSAQAKAQAMSNGDSAAVAAPAPARVAPAPVAPAPPQPAAAPPVPPTPVTVAHDPTPTAVVGDPVLDQVTSVVAEMTGYPADLLEPDLDLEADLGVDTVKQAEVFAAVREHYDVERDDNLQLRDFPTLRHVADWVRNKAGLDAAPAAVTAPAPAPVDGRAAPAATGGDPVLAQVTSVVAEMTGYPADLLEPDLDLEADLGVDTVKQAEVFAAVREHYDVERDDNLQLRDFPTLRHVADWVRNKAGLDAAPAAATAAPAEPAAPATAGDPVLDQVTSVVAEMTGYPADLLEPDLDLEADLGVDTVKQAEVFAAVREHYDVERDDNLQLRDFPTLRHVADWVRNKAGLGAAPAAEPVPAQVAAAPAAPAPAATSDPVLDQVTSVVAEMTGYPADLLEPDLDLEADLGVDTVKQAEVFAAVREHYDVERDDNLQLRDFPTLRHVADWVRARAGLEVAPPASEPVDGGAAPAAAGGGDPVLAQVTSVVAEMTGYPADLLEPDLDLEADLGVDTVKQAEVFAAVREHYDVERDDNLQLRDFPTLRHVADWVRARAGLDTATPAPPASNDALAPAAVAPDVVKGDLDAVDALPRRVPVPSLRPNANRCVPTGVDLTGARVVVMLDEGGIGAALVKQLNGAGAEPLTIEAGTTTDDLLEQLGAWHDERPDQRRLLAPRARRRRRPRRLRPRSLARVTATAGQGALRHDAPSLRRKPVPRLGDQAGRLPRIRRSRGNEPARRSRGRIHQVVQEGTTRRPRQGGRRRGQPPDHGHREPADRGDALRSRLRRDRTRRRPSVRCRVRRAAASPTRPGHRRRRGDATRTGFGVRGDRRRRQHRVGDHRRPRRGLGWHLPPARSHADTGPRRRRPEGIRRRPQRAQGHDRSTDEGGRRTCDTRCDRTRTEPNRTPQRCAHRCAGRRSRRWHRSLPLRRPHRRRRCCQGDRRRPRTQRSHRRAPSRCGLGDQPESSGQGTPRVQPGVRRQERRLVQRLPCCTRHADRSDCGVLVGGGPVRQPGTNGLFGCERPVVQDHEQHASRSANDACAGPRLDGVGRHRDGHARFDPQDHGDGWGADAAPGSRCCLDPA